MASPTYQTVNQFIAANPAFSAGGLRALIFNEHSNGLAKACAIIRIGRRVLINEELFIGWIQAQAGSK